MKKKEIVDIINSRSTDECPLRGSKKSEAICNFCKFYKNEKCTFNIWKWKGIGGR